MKQLQIFILLITTLISNVIAQNKDILGDTSFCYPCNKKMIAKFGLKDFYTSQDDFNFRFKKFNQIIEVSKNNDTIFGELTNYIFKLKYKNLKKTDTLFNKIELSKTEVQTILNIINQSKIMDLPSMNKIEKWSGGFDGTTYTIEHSNKEKYWYKLYWTPSVQDSIPESLIVMDFVKTISDTLQLTEKYEEFESTLPKTGCYQSGGMLVVCHVGNFLEFGYTGSAKLPFGYHSFYHSYNIGKIKTNFGVGVQQRFDNNKNSDLEVTLGKGDVFHYKHKTRDFLIYNYRNRKLNFIDSVNIFKNSQLFYGLSFNNHLAIALGFDYLHQQYEKIGGLIYMSKWFSKPRIDFIIKISFFENNIDYKIGLSRSFIFNKVRIIRNQVRLGLYYENFKNNDDLFLTFILSI